MDVLRTLACVFVLAQLAPLSWAHERTAVAGGTADFHVTRLPMYPTWTTPAATLDEALRSTRIAGETLDVLADKGRAAVIVQLRTRLPFSSEGHLSEVQVNEQQRDIAAAQALILRKLQEKVRGSEIAHVKRYQTIPYLALQGNKEVLTALVAMKEVLRVFPDRTIALDLATSIPRIGADLVHRAAETPDDDTFEGGRGQAIAILDTGVDATHQFLAGRVVAEACFTRGDCLDGSDSAVGPGAAMPCSYAGCFHGTHVAGIAAGGGSFFRGVAPSASIISVRVFGPSERDVRKGPRPPCGAADDRPTESVTTTGAADSDIVAGLEHVYLLRHAHAIAAVNLSLGTGQYTSRSACDSDVAHYHDVVQNLRDTNIAVIASSGNWGEACIDGRVQFQMGIGAPACVSGIVSVGNADNGDAVHRTSSTWPLLDLLAPGTNINSSVPGGGYDRATGTSMAAPHVTGTWALLQAVAPWMSAGEILSRLKSSGVPIVDQRPVTLSPSEPAIVTPRIQVNAAYEAISGAPLAPNGLRVVGAGGTGLFVQWEENSRSEARFEIDGVPINAPHILGSVRESVGPNVTTASVSRLTPNTRYELRVRACGSSGQCSPRSRAVGAQTHDTLPTTPHNFRAGTVTETSIRVLWDSQSRNSVMNFLLHSDAYSDRRWRSRPVAANDHEATFGNLAPTAAYNFLLQACNDDGCSDNTPNLHVATQTTGPRPTAPTNLRLCASGATLRSPICSAGGVTLLWDDTAQNEDYFEFEWSRSPLRGLPPAGQRAWTPVRVPADRESHTLWQPISGDYLFRVRACNITDCSAYSNVVQYQVQ